MRTGQFNSIGGHLGNMAFMSRENNEKDMENILKQHQIGKTQLWEKFIDQFARIHGKEFIYEEQTIENFMPIFYYFLRDPRFFDCSALKGDLSIPSFNKGLLIIGGFGVGKTDIMKTFETLFKRFDGLRYKMFSTPSVVNTFESCGTPEDKSAFFKNMKTGTILLDDLSSEEIASNYGKTDIMKRVILERYDSRLLTHMICNFSNLEMDVVQTLQDLGDRYGSRVYDRLFEMFNIIVFKGKSFRR
ncbi:hypothetical protein [Mangrovimonas sp. ST2L15]|uniref:hypothetical protein n=1 Tax=Mangrovimonas sp. ST2L15 TaxID=1645916 RepID=UPI0006B56E92|nr:hypothetical protein [Mangrovimonas sp. ST2L15]